MPRLHAFAIALSLVCTAGAMLPAQAASIAINNASFEVDVLADDANTDNLVTAWSSRIGSFCSPQCFGAYNPGLGSVSIPSGQVPDGNNVLYATSLFGLPIVQTLTGFVLEANTRYTLTVAVGNTVDVADVGTFGFQLGVVDSDNVYATLSSSLAAIPNGSFGDLTASSEVTAGNPDIGKTLVVRLFGPQNPGPGQPYVVFDNVRLEATSAVPEPASTAMWLAGLGLLGYFTRRSKQTARA